MSKKELKASKEIPDGAKIISSGILEESVEREIKMTASIYKYIEEQVHFYDDESDLNRCSWIDVEGFGYGWLWLNRPENEWHKMMCESIDKAFKYVLHKNHNKAEYIIYEYKKSKVYHIITHEDFREDYVFSFSNEELYF